MLRSVDGPFCGSVDGPFYASRLKGVGCASECGWPLLRRYGDVPGLIGVLETLDKFMPIGEAPCVTWNENGLAVWTLRMGKQELPGRWVIVDREFRPAK